MDAERHLYDKSHYAHTAGKFGRLQTLSVIPVCAGDSVEVNLDGIIRLSPLRREIVTDVQVDILAFYIPHRHIYSNWVDGIREGYDSDNTYTVFNVPNAATDLSAPYLAVPRATADTYYKYDLVAGYNRIWNRYFRVPSFAEVGDTTFPTGSGDDAVESRLFGRRCARLPHMINAGLRTDGLGYRDLDDDDAEVAAGSVLDIRDLAQVKAQYKSEARSVWFAERYTDVLNVRWGTEVNIDADQRPELCFRETYMMSGWDVDGTADANLGSYTGKTVAQVRFNMPRKYFVEHGNLWIMALIRPPMIHAYEQHPFNKSMVHDPAVLFGDPEILAATPPKAWNPGLWLAFNAYSGSAPDFYIPAGQEWRFMTNNVHPVFSENEGYPFSKDAYVDTATAFYFQPGEYDDVFYTLQLGHWQMHTVVNTEVLSHVPPATESIFAGGE